MVGQARHGRAGSDDGSRGSRFAPGVAAHVSGPRQQSGFEPGRPAAPETTGNCTCNISNTSLSCYFSFKTSTNIFMFKIQSKRCVKIEWRHSEGISCSINVSIMCFSFFLSWPLFLYPVLLFFSLSHHSTASCPFTTTQTPRRGMRCERGAKSKCT